MAGDMPVIARSVTFAELCLLIDSLPSRIPAADEPVIAAKAIVPLRLVAPGRKPIPLPVRSSVTEPAIQSVAYQPLEAPAPIVQQVGHYLPYRPSRIAIEGARDHPTPLVESIAMGLNHGTVARGCSSASLKPHRRWPAFGGTDRDADLCSERPFARPCWTLRT